MNQEKIGKLIAKLRREKNLTQRELGEMVGVGYRAVSKWETGLTMPDISIIHELSTILGISSDELLKGELKDSKNQPNEIITKQKSNNKLRLLLLIVSSLIIFGIVLFTIMSKKASMQLTEYIINSAKPNEYLVDGAMKIDNNDLIVSINKIEFQDYTKYQTKIKDYRYSVFLDDYLIIGYGGSDEYSNIDNGTTIDSFLKNFQIYYSESLNEEDIQLVGEKLVILLALIDVNDNEIQYSIETTLVPKKIKKAQYSTHKAE